MCRIGRQCELFRRGTAPSGARRAAVPAVLALLVLSIPAFGVQPDEPGAAAPADHARQNVRRAQLDELIRRHLNSIREPSPEPLTAMINHAESLQDLAQQIGRFLEEFPDDPAFVRLTLSRLEAIYISCTVRGSGFARINQEAEKLRASDSPELKEAGEYWQLRVRLNEIEARRALGEKLDGAAVDAMRGFIDRYPASVRSIPLIEKVVQIALELNNDAWIDSLMGLMTKYHPDHPSTRSLEGRVRLRRNLGRPWRPALRTLDDREFDWKITAGRPTVVLFWASAHSPSVRTLGVLRSIRSRIKDAEFNVVAIAVERDAESATRALAQADLICHPTILRDSWKSELTQAYGIRSLPTILLLDDKLQLKTIIEPKEWNTGPRLTTALSELLSMPLTLEPEPTTTPAATSPADPPATGG